MNQANNIILFEDRIKLQIDFFSVGILAVEMESAGLFANAAAAGVDALGIFTVSDIIFAGKHTTPDERQTAFTKMIEIALELA